MELRLEFADSHRSLYRVDPTHVPARVDELLEGLMVTHPAARIAGDPLAITAFTSGALAERIGLYRIAVDNAN